MRHYIRLFLILFTGIQVWVVGEGQAGTLDSPALPDDPGSAMYTLDDIFDYIDTGQPAGKRSGGFVGPSSPPGVTGHSLDDIYEKLRARTPAPSPASANPGRLIYDRASYIVGNVRDTDYTHMADCRLDEEAGRYRHDCSGLVGEFILGELMPEHRRVLCVDDGVCDDYLSCGDSGSVASYTRPLAGDFYTYFDQHSDGTYWLQVNSLADAQPGDIIVAKYYNQGATSGHVMVVHTAPVPSVVNSNEYYLFVIDSAESGHCNDIRRAEFSCCGQTNAYAGIARGKMWFGVDVDGRPIYYRWSGVSNCKYCQYEDGPDGPSGSDPGCGADEVCDATKYLEGIRIGRAVGGFE